MTGTPRRAATGLVAALLLAGCTDGPTDSSRLPLRLSVQPRDTLAPGDTLRMTAYLVNPGRQPVRLQFDDQCSVEFYVMAPDHTVLYPPGGGTACTGGPTELNLPPRDSVRFSASWLVASAFIREHTAYAVLWEHHVPHGEKREYEKGHRSNIAVFHVAAPER